MFHNAPLQLPRQLLMNVLICLAVDETMVDLQAMVVNMIVLKVPTRCPSGTGTR